MSIVRAEELVVMSTLKSLTTVALLLAQASSLAEKTLTLFPKGLLRTALWRIVPAPLLRVSRHAIIFTVLPEGPETSVEAKPG